jgi:UDP-glucose 4-epimerase
LTLNEIFQSFKPEAVLHFAGLKAVAESETLPLSYYEQNICSTIELLKAMDKKKGR